MATPAADDVLGLSRPAPSLVTHVIPATLDLGLGPCASSVRVNACNAGACSLDGTDLDNLLSPFVLVRRRATSFEKSSIFT